MPEIVPSEIQSSQAKRKTKQKDMPFESREVRAGKA